MVKKKSKKSYFTFHRSLSIGLFILLSILVYRKLVSTPLPVQDNIKLTNENQEEDDEMSVSSSGDNTISSNLYVNGAVRLLIILVLVVLLTRVQNYFRNERRINELNRKRKNDQQLDEVLYDGENSYEIANSHKKTLSPN